MHQQIGTSEHRGPLSPSSSAPEAHFIGTPTASPSESPRSNPGELPTAGYRNACFIGQSSASPAASSRFNPVQRPKKGSLDGVTLPGPGSACAVCGIPAHGVCEACNLVAYCSPACQRQHWVAQHRKVCCREPPGISGSQDTDFDLICWAAKRFADAVASIVSQEHQQGRDASNTCFAIGGSNSDIDCMLQNLNSAASEVTVSSRPNTHLQAASWLGSAASASSGSTIDSVNAGKGSGSSAHASGSADRYTALVQESATTPSASSSGLGIDSAPRSSVSTIRASSGSCISSSSSSSSSSRHRGQVLGVSTAARACISGSSRRSTSSSSADACGSGDSNVVQNEVDALLSYASSTHESGASGSSDWYTLHGVPKKPSAATAMSQDSDKAEAIELGQQSPFVASTSEGSCGEPGSKPEAVALCNNGHVMVTQELFYAGVCDLCWTELPKGAEIPRCAKCLFDLCRKCSTKRVLAGPFRTLLVPASEEPAEPREPSIDETPAGKDAQIGSLASSPRQFNAPLPTPAAAPEPPNSGKPASASSSGSSASTGQLKVGKTVAEPVIASSSGGSTALLRPLIHTEARSSPGSASALPPELPFSLPPSSTGGPPGVASSHVSGSAPLAALAVAKQSAAVARPTFGAIAIVDRSTSSQASALSSTAAPPAGRPQLPLCRGKDVENMEASLQECGTSPSHEVAAALSPKIQGDPALGWTAADSKSSSMLASTSALPAESSAVPRTPADEMSTVEWEIVEPSDTSSLLSARQSSQQTVSPRDAFLLSESAPQLELSTPEATAATSSKLPVSDWEKVSQTSEQNAAPSCASSVSASASPPELSFAAVTAAEAAAAAVEVNPIDEKVVEPLSGSLLAQLGESDLHSEVSPAPEETELQRVPGQVIEPSSTSPKASGKENTQWSVGAGSSCSAPMSTLISEESAALTPTHRPSLDKKVVQPFNSYLQAQQTAVPKMTSAAASASSSEPDVSLAPEEYELEGFQTQTFESNSASPQASCSDSTPSLAAPRGASCAASETPLVSEWSAAPPAANMPALDSKIVEPSSSSLQVQQTVVPKLILAPSSFSSSLPEVSLPAEEADLQSCEGQAIEHDSAPLQAVGRRSTQWLAAPSGIPYEASVSPLISERSAALPTAHTSTLDPQTMERSSYSLRAQQTVVPKSMFIKASMSYAVPEVSQEEAKLQSFQGQVTEPNIASSKALGRRTTQWSAGHSSPSSGSISSQEEIEELETPPLEEMEELELPTLEEIEDWQDGLDSKRLCDSSGFEASLDESLQHSARQIVRRRLRALAARDVEASNLSPPEQAIAPPMGLGMPSSPGLGPPASAGKVSESIHLRRRWQSEAAQATMQQLMPTVAGWDRPRAGNSPGPTRFFIGDDDEDKGAHDEDEATQEELSSASTSSEEGLSRAPPGFMGPLPCSEEEDIADNVNDSWGTTPFLVPKKADPVEVRIPCLTTHSPKVHSPKVHSHKVQENAIVDPNAEESSHSDEQVESRTMPVPVIFNSTAEGSGVQKPSNSGLEEQLLRWKDVVNELWPELSEEDAEDLEELHQLLEDTETKAIRGMTSRCEVCEDGLKPVLVTAPHCVYLLRDGQKPHVVEEYTAAIARAMTRHLSGTSLMWTCSEQRATELLWCLSRRRGCNPGQALDPRNRDPNYLSTEELDGNAWFQQMRRTAAHWRELKGMETSLLHLDVHGCKDPPETPSHLTVGLGAMRIQAERTGNDKELERVEIFGKALEMELSSVLADLKLKPRAKLVRVVIPSTQTLQSHTRFAGAWKPADRRHTQTQQAVSFADFTHAAQLEMSKTLRRALLQNQIGITRFSNAIRAAWVKSKRI